LEIRNTMCAMLLFGLLLLLGSGSALCEWTHVGPDSCTCKCVVYRSGDSDSAFATMAGFVYRSCDGGLTWSVPDSAVSGGELAPDPVDKSTIYLVNQVAVYKSIDAGETWGIQSNGITLDPGDQFLQCIAVNPCHPESVYVSMTDFGACGAMWRTADGGDNWRIAEMPGARAIAIDPIDCGRMYSAADGDRGIFRSTDSGTTWEMVLAETADDIAINWQWPHRAYVTAGGVVYRSADWGDTWTSFGPEAGLTGYALTVAVNPVNQNVVYAGGPNGVFRSTDGGTTWVDYSEGLPTSTFVYSIAADGESGEAVLVGTYAHGIFRRTDGLAGVLLPTNPGQTSSLALEACPNPFAGETLISYTLPATSETSIAVYDVSGRKVAALVDKSEATGAHQTRWDGRDLHGEIAGPGVYFVRIQNGQTSTVKSIVLFK
jgi:photosystem II stability/assembly factor-like uncharacterized protein